jgi:predicted NAD/FAD-binding protein
MTRAAASLGTGRKRLAVVGTGVAGCSRPNGLATAHDVVVFEARTASAATRTRSTCRPPPVPLAVDTGFIVCNDRTYPGFLALLQRLGVPLRPSTMSFSVRCERTGLEYNGGTSTSCSRSVATCCGRRSGACCATSCASIARRRDYGDSDGDARRRAGAGRFGRAFTEHYLVPMMAAIWSAEPQRLLGMPARFFVRFFHNHGMLSVNDRPQWFTVVGGSRSYLGPLTRSFARPHPARRRCVAVVRSGDGVLVRCRTAARAFDGAVLATHSDQALRCSATRRRRNAPCSARSRTRRTTSCCTPMRACCRGAGAPGRRGTTICRPTPNPRATRHLLHEPAAGPAGPTVYNVTLNRTDAIDPAKVLRRFVYHHPVFDVAGVAAQARVADVNGSGRVWFCGAWCGFGFHEDGVQAALRVAADFGRRRRRGPRGCTRRRDDGPRGDRRRPRPQWLHSCLYVGTCAIAGSTR